MFAIGAFLILIGLLCSYKIFKTDIGGDMGQWVSASNETPRHNAEIRIKYRGKKYLGRYRSNRGYHSGDNVFTDIKKIKWWKPNISIEHGNN